MTAQRTRWPFDDDSDPGLQVRSFLAIVLPPGVRQGLAELTSRLAASSEGGKWVAEENFHLTIKFLGNLDDAALQQLGSPLRGAVESWPPFQVALGGLSSFPERGEPRVVWLGLGEGAEDTTALHGSIEQPLVARNLASEDTKRFTPHVTLARARSRRGLVTEGDFFETLVPPAAMEPFLVNEVTLYMSELTPTGPIYTVMSAVPLRG